MSKDLITRLRNAAQVLDEYKVALKDAPPSLYGEAADAIESLRQQRTEARMLLDEVQAKHASDPLPERIYDFLKRTKEKAV